jgi:hypothetical protein
MSNADPKQSHNRVRPTRLVAEALTILSRLAADVEFGRDAFSTARRELAVIELSCWMERHEAAALVDIFTSERIRCIDCGKTPQRSRASGMLCLWCARKAKNEAEAAENGS